MIVAVLMRPDLDKELAAKVAYWLRPFAKKDKHGQTDVEFYIYGDKALDTDT